MEMATLTPEHLAKMAAGRARAAQERGARAAKRAVRGKMPVEIPASYGDGGLKGVAVTPSHLTHPADVMRATHKTRPEIALDHMTVEQAKAIRAASDLGVYFPADQLARALDTLNPAPKKLAPGEIDYEKLAEMVAAKLRPMVQHQQDPLGLAQAGLRNQAIQSQVGQSGWNLQNSQVTQYPKIERDDRGMPVTAAYDENLVVPGNNVVNRVLSQLSYPPDKEGQVLAMIAANMAPSWDANNQEVTDAPYPPVQERMLVAHMQEYCQTLRPELPKTRLVPKYKLSTDVAPATTAAEAVQHA